MSNTKFCFTSFKIWEVVVPLDGSMLGLPAEVAWPKLPIYLVEGATSGGFSAVGECARGTPFESVQKTLQGLLGVDLHKTTPPTAWMKPYDPQQVPSGYPVWAQGAGESQQNAIADAVGMTRLYPVWSWAGAGLASYMLLESLWLDAMGKRAGMAAHQLLGGAVRREVPVDLWAVRPDVSQLRAILKAAGQRGIRGLKIKSGVRGDTVLSLYALREELPEDFRITVDAMCAWRTSRENGRLFEMLAELPCAVQIEDPFPYENRDDWRKVRESRIATLICHARGENVLEAALRDEIADAFNLGGGSAYEFLKLATVADFHGKDCWHGSGMELGVLQALHLHAASCARNCLLASDLQSEWTREHTLVHPRMSYRGNSALLSDAPGLGVELDLKSLERYCVKHHTITL